MKNLKVLVAVLTTGLLTACGGPPSESVIDEIMRAQMDEAASAFASFGGQTIAESDLPSNNVESVERVGCEEEGSKTYICLVRITMKEGAGIPMMGTEFTSRIRFMLTDEGWYAEEL